MNIPDGIGQRLQAGFGPQPTAGEPAGTQRLNRAAATVLDLLAAQRRPATAAELADQAEQHPNTIREHLDDLVDAGLATRERAPAAGRGRPAWLYAAAPAERAGHTEYAGLATALAMQMARTSTRPQEEARQAGQAWGAQLAMTAPDQSPTPARARRQVVAVLDGLGFAPVPNPRATTVRLERCPLLAAAKEHPEVVCAVHLGIVQGALSSWEAPSDGARLVPFAEPGACLLHLPTAAGSTQGAG